MLLVCCLISGTAKAELPPDQVTFDELYKVSRSKAELTPRQNAYLYGIAATMAWADLRAWDLNDAGLYCLPNGQRVDPEFLMYIMDNELGSERGWVYGDIEPAAKIIVNGLVFQYPCTEEELARRRRENKDISESILDGAFFQTK